MLTQEKLKKVLHYNPDTGIFIWLDTKSNALKNGDIAGCKSKAGYISIKVGGSAILAHRLAFLYMEGYIPTKHIDHINGITSDNRYVNLREASRFQNLANCKLSKANTSGIKGVCYEARYNRYIGCIGANGKVYKNISKQRGRP